MTRSTVTINKSNINTFRTGTFNSSRLIWRYEQIDAQVLSNFSRLRRLTIQTPQPNGLEGIHVCHSLYYLNIYYSCDIRPVSALTELRTFVIRGSIPNIQPLLTCTKLRTLKINAWQERTDVTDLTGIERLTNLEHLYVLANIPIPFSTVTQLGKLVHLRVNHTGDLVAIPKLICLGVRLAGGLELDQLKLFPQLRALTVNVPSTGSRHAIQPTANLDWASSLTALESLVVECKRKLKDIQAVRSFPNLKKFGCKYESVSDLSALSCCPLLRVLSCNGCSVASLEGLGSCTNLRQAYLWNSYNSFEKTKGLSVKPLANCHKLNSFYAQGYRLIDAHVISNWPELEDLYLDDTGITNVDFLLGCTKLISLEINSNDISNIDCITAPNLTSLGISYTSIRAVSFDKYPLLKYLTINDCKLRDWTSLSALTKLRFLQADDCGLKTMGESVLPKLSWLSASNNGLTAFPFELYPKLKTLDISSNEITAIDGLNLCPRLKSLKLQHNHITNISSICCMQTIEHLEYEGNPLGPQNPRTSRILQRFVGQAKITDNIYANSQNVHDSTIQQSVRKSVANLLQDPVTVFDPSAILESDLPAETKSIIIDYCSNETVHSTHDLTYAELFAYVWARIQRHEARAVLYQILADQIRDSECKCFTGRFNRTLSVLIGFYDDIFINISDSSRISAIVIAVGNKIDPYDPIAHRTLATQALIAASYEAYEYQPWIDAIED